MPRYNHLARGSSSDTKSFQSKIWEEIPNIDIARKVAKLGVLLFFLVIIAAIWAPWQQTVPGEGKVIAFSASERTQRIDATISGRVSKWHVREGQSVKRGDMIAELSDNDPEILLKFGTERESLENKLANHESRLTTLRERMDSIRASREAQLSSAQADIEMAQADLLSLEQSLISAQAELETGEIQLKRQQALGSSGLVSNRDLELAELAVRKARATEKAANASIAAAKNRLQSRMAASRRVEATSSAEIQSAELGIKDAENDVADAQGLLARLGVDISRQHAQILKATADGTIFRILVRENGEQVSKGQPVALVVPATSVRAVALHVDGNDASLIAEGKKVRLQFDGWPGIQFSGWPSVAVGTFGGVVSFVDATDNGDGSFRVVVIPDEKDEPWPDAKYLRQGVRARAWFLLKEVTLGFEIWRRLNGFPPSTYAMNEFEQESYSYSSEKETGSKKADKSKAKKKKSEGYEKK